MLYEMNDDFTEEDMNNCCKHFTNLLTVDFKFPMFPMCPLTVSQLTRLCKYPKCNKIDNRIEEKNYIESEVG